MSTFQKIVQMAMLNDAVDELMEKSTLWAEGRMRHASQKMVRFKIGRLQERVLRGRVYQFFYDAKHKETLPYYDAFPYVIVLEKYDDGFLGINMHYLPLYHRAILFDRLDLLTRHPNMEPDEQSRMMLRYDRLSKVRRFRFHKPALKRYLYSQIQGPVYQIPGNLWRMALFLPTTDFMHKRAQIRAKRVHFDSRRQINKGI